MNGRGSTLEGVYPGGGLPFAYPASVSGRGCSLLMFASIKCAFQTSLSVMHGVGLGGVGQSLPSGLIIACRA